MNKRFIILSAFVLAASFALAHGSDPHGQNPEDLKWGPAPNFLPKGAQITILDGDPGKAVGITLRMKLPAGYQVPAHWHPTQENVTVLSGSLHVGMGNVLDKKAGQLLKVGGFAALPPRMNHFIWTEEETVVQVHLQGPFAVTYVDKALDPRNY